MAATGSVTKKQSFPEFIEGVRASTSKKHILKLNPVEARMLELDDVLYHTNSAVLMPEVPQSGTAAPANQVTGLRAIALGLKQVEFDPRQTILIAAHTDTEGDAYSNFNLSEKRGNGIYSLMTSGRREEWARISTDQHVVEDFQQILKYLFDKNGWTGCDPGQINNTWNAKTKSATEAFIDKYNSDVVHGSTPPPGSLEIQKKNTIYYIEQDWKHRWVIELWRAVYDIYVGEIMKALNVDRTLLDSRYRSKAKFLKNVDNEPYLGCGESHPIDQAHKNDYRSQKNRRVEIYFFNEIAMKNAWPRFLKWWIDHPCPVLKRQIHGPEICPLWHNLLFKKLPIEEADLTCVGYHLKFYFWERKTNTRRSMPDGLPINAFSDVQETLNLNARLSYMPGDGVYLVKVPDDKARSHIHFSFNSIQGSDTTPRWVHLTPGSSPNTFNKQIVTENQIRQQNNNTALGDLPFDRQLEYYDVPARWSSVNYHTRYDNDFDKEDIFEQVLRTRKQFKPYGQNITAPTEPLTFSLDDIVLLDAAGGTQAIRDADHWATDLNIVPGGTNPAHYPALQVTTGGVTVTSRIKIFIVNETTGRLELYKTGTADNTARIPFPSNYIAVKAAGFIRARIVFFRDGFYTIGSHRSTATSGWEASGFVLGARAAVRNDQRRHQQWVMAGSNFHTPEEFHASGDYDLHYFHHMYFMNGRPVSYLIKYVSISFIGDTRAGATIPAWTPDIANFIDSGVYNAMKRWAVNPYYFEERSHSAATPTDATIIRLLSFFDERETFQVAPGNPAGRPTNINFEEESALGPLWSNTAFRDARTLARGGKSKYLAFICNGVPPDTYRAWQHEIRTWGSSPYSQLAYDVADYQESANTRQERPEGSFGDLTMAHELGHATGLVDEYIIDNFEISQQSTPPGGAPVISTFASYDQAWEPYETESQDNLAIMYWNYMPRMHHHWYALHFLNSQILLNQHQMNRFFPSTRQFVIKDDNRPASIYSRGIMSQNATHVRHIEKTAGMRVPLDCRRPMFRTQQHPIPGTSNRRLSLALYDVGDDRSSTEEFYPTQFLHDYSGVLTVKLMLRLRFEGGVNHAFWRPGTTNLSRCINRIANTWKARSQLYHLINGPTGMNEIFINFIPGFTSGHDLRTNFNVIFLRSTTPAGQLPIVMNGNTLRVRFNFTETDLMQSILGPTAVINNPINPATERPSWIFLEAWARTQLHNNALTLRTI